MDKHQYHTDTGLNTHTDPHQCVAVMAASLESEVEPVHTVRGSVWNEPAGQTDGVSWQNNFH